MGLLAFFAAGSITWLPAFFGMVQIQNVNSMKQP
jgi:hypothetical protein